MGVSFKIEKRRNRCPLFAQSFPVSLRFLILKETPMAPVFIGGQAQKSMLVGELNLMGLPGETMRRMVPSKGRG
jgi:hypothetical protein